MRRALVACTIVMLGLGLAGCAHWDSEMQEIDQFLAEEAKAAAVEEPESVEPPVCPVSTDNWDYTWGVNPADVGTHVADWMNTHPVETWPIHKYGDDERDADATADLIEEQVFQPMGCDDMAISLLTATAVYDAYDEWYRAQHPGSSLPADTQPNPGSGSGGSAGCRIGFGSGGFSWSCSVSS